MKKRMALIFALVCVCGLVGRIETQEENTPTTDEEKWAMVMVDG